MDVGRAGGMRAGPRLLPVKATPELSGLQGAVRARRPELACTVGEDSEGAGAGGHPALRPCTQAEAGADSRQLRRSSCCALDDRCARGRASRGQGRRLSSPRGGVPLRSPRRRDFISLPSRLAFLGACDIYVLTSR